MHLWYCCRGFRFRFRLSSCITFSIFGIFLHCLPVLSAQSSLLSANNLKYKMQYKCAFHTVKLTLLLFYGLCVSFTAGECKLARWRWEAISFGQKTLEYWIWRSSFWVFQGGASPLSFACFTFENIHDFVTIRYCFVYSSLFQPCIWCFSSSRWWARLCSSKSLFSPVVILIHCLNQVLLVNYTTSSGINVTAKFSETPEADTKKDVRDIANLQEPGDNGEQSPFEKSAEGKSLLWYHCAIAG